MDSKLRRLVYAAHARETHDAMSTPRGWTVNLNYSSEPYCCRQCGETIREGEPVLLWLDDVDEDTERALSPTMRELVEALRSLKAAQEGER